MRKSLLSVLTRKITLALLLMLVSVFKLQAQVDIAIGTGTNGNTQTTYPCPLQDWYEGSKMQYLYRASELNAAGMGPGTISSIKFNVLTLATSTNLFPAIEQFTLKIGVTSNNSLSNTVWETGLVTVYGPLDYTSTLGINTFTLSSPFFWNGSSNIVIEVCNGDPNNTADIYYTGNPVIPWTTGLSFNGSHTYRLDNAGNLCGAGDNADNGLGVQTTRPNIIFNWTSASACSGTPTAGTANSTLTNILCPGTPFTLSLTGATLASGLTYQWQSSPDNTTWTNIAGATTSSYTTTQAQPTMYYQCIVTCSNGGANSTSTSVQVNSVAGPTYAPLPYIESFENTWINGCGTRDLPNQSWKNTPPTTNNSWRRDDDGGAAGWTSNNGAYTPAASAGIHSARFHSYDAANGTNGTLDVYLNCNTPATTKRMNFDFINTSGADSLTVLISTNGGASFSRLDSGGIATAWRGKTILFNSQSATTIIRFRGNSDFGVTDIGVDNIRITDFDNCTGTPNGGTATSNKTNVCLGELFTLTVVGSTDANGLTYQWQSSPDNATWTNITGATNYTYTTSQAVSTYYHCVVTCTFNSVASPSTSVLVNSPTLVSGTFTINNLAPTGGTNFNNFNDAYNYIKCGINGPVIFNVVVGSGPYNEQLIMTPVPGASPVNTVTFNGNGVSAIQFTSTNTNERATIKLNGADYINFKNLVINANGASATEYGYGVQLINNADSNSVSNCIININTTSTSTNFAGIVVSASATNAIGTGTTSCDGNLFSSNTIKGGYYGLTLVSANTPAIIGNKAINNDIRDFYSYGIYIAGNYQSLIDSNTISRPSRATVTTMYGIYVTGVSPSMTITRNTITNPYGAIPTATSAFYGVYFTGVSVLSGFENVVSNTLVYNLTGNGDVYGIYNASSGNVWYYHNTLVMDGAAPTTTATNVTRGFYQTTQADGIRFVNNIVTLSRAGLSNKHCIYFATTTSTIISQKNDFYITSATGANNIGFFNSNQSTLINWQTASGQDLNSVSTNPVYLNPGAGNYQPTSQSVDNLGIFVGVTKDILGIARSNSTPDIGAYEFSPPPCTVPPVAGTASVTPNVVCQGIPVALSVSGNTVGLNQTYQWQTSATIGGPYTPLGGVLINPDTTVLSTSTLYYQLAVTCSGNTTYSTPALLTVNPSLAAGTYTINALAPASPTNFVSFNAAKAAMNCGILGPIVFDVVANSGPYNEQLTLDSIRGTSPVNTITFKGNGNTIAFSSNNTNERAVIKLRGADYITFDSLRINATGAGTYGYGVQLVANADTNTFRKCIIIANTTSTSTTNYGGIVINASETGNTTTGNTLCDGNTFDMNAISGGYAGATLVGNPGGALISKNKFTNNTFDDFYTYGIYVAGTTGTLIEANTFRRPTRATPPNFFGVYFTGISNTALVTRNTITNPFGALPTSTNTFYGIYFTGADATAGFENRVTNNLVYNVNNEGPQYGMYNTSSDYALYYHNTISLDKTTSTTASLTRGFYYITDALGIVFKNNIITITRGGTGTKHAIYFDTNPNTIVANRNNYYVNGSAGTNVTGYNGQDRITLADWQGATSQDANSIALDPIYANPLVGDFTPGLTPFDNTAEPVGVLNDILGISRSATTPDIGAFEFSLPPCIAPPTAGSTSVNPSSGICLGASVALNLSGNSGGGGQTYVWQASPDGISGWTDISPVLYRPPYTTQATLNTYYRCAVSCSGNTVYSPVGNVTLNALFPAGTYTINSSLPTVYPPVPGSNFNNFNDAVLAMDCGVTGPVIFNVQFGTNGIYNEQVRMHNIPGTSDNVRITFQSATGDPASVRLTYNATVATSNYVLKFDSASYITYKAITIAATNAANGRAVEFANTASKDSLLNCSITVPANGTTGNTVVGVFANGLKGSNNVIKGNTIVNGASGVYFAGTSAAILTKNNVIDSNTIFNAYYYGIYTSFTDRVKTRLNTVNMATPLNATSYGIYANNPDSSYDISSNTVNINGTPGTVYGMYLANGHSTVLTRGKVAGNRIIAGTGNSGTIYGLYQTGMLYNNTVNNVISINTTATSSYGLYQTGGGSLNFYNNSVNNISASGTNSYAGYFNQTSGTRSNVKNNIFAHNNAGKAMFMGNLNYTYSDYNMLYTNGATLLTGGTTNYATLQAWRNASFWDVNSIVYKPSYISNTDLQPNLTDPNVWAMHGRGVQIVGNNYDFNNNSRPTTLTTGVPDLGAYEFLPTSIPTVLTATPAAPVANSTQTFMYGTDTVTKITWGALVPASVTARRYSGVLPPGVAANSSMYFYVDIDTTGTDPLTYTIQQYYIDPWQGFIPRENQTRLGRTDAAAAWITGATSTVDDSRNIIAESNLSYVDKYTGLIGSASQPYTPTAIAPSDSSNRGTNFWVMYGHNYYFGSDNSQQMALYLSAEAPAKVTVKINGTSWVRQFSIPANTVVVCDSIPKTGVYDARILEEGQSDRGISITSDTPIVAYAHCYGGATSGASLLFPIGTYGYEYFTVNFRQNYSTSPPTYSWLNVIANYDSTLVEITPTQPTLGGRTPNVPFTVYLNKGEVYQVLGQLIGTSAQGYDLTGSKVRSVSNASGRCFPIAVFSGSSRTGFGCNGSSGGSGDYFIQQNFPSQAWGKRYLTAPTSTGASASSYMTNIFRVIVKDPTTVVKRNGVTMTGLINNFYYEFESNATNEITADKPIAVAQYMSSSGSCPNTGGDGDPEMIYISPIEQGIKQIGLYRTNRQAINESYLTMIVPTAALPSLTIDNVNNAWSTTYAHTVPGYSVVVKRWSPAGPAQVLVKCDSAFTAITYGLGSVESYGYNAGTLVKNLNALPAINNVYSSGGGASPYTCAKTPFRFTLLLPLIPTTLEWHFSQVANLTPNVDSLQINPVPIDSIIVNGVKFYKFTVLQDYVISTPGTYVVPIVFTHPSIEGCTGRLEQTLSITVLPSPIADFNTNFTGCIGDVATFTATGTTSNAVPMNQFGWDFGDATQATGNPVNKQYAAPGTYTVKLRGIADDGCIADTAKQIVVHARPTVNVVPDSLSVCQDSSATFSVQNPVSGVTYNWYTVATGGTPVGTGTSYTLTSAPLGTTELYVEAVEFGCPSVTRKRLVVTTLPTVGTPVVTVDSVGATVIRWKWNPVPNAVSYEVSRDNGSTWSVPSSGPTGTTHTISGLTPNTTITLLVRALGGCEMKVSAPVSATTFTDQIWIPNAFTPNGDGKNDIHLVYGYVIRDLQMMVFNQWGEKIFESRQQSKGWDGTYKGKPQPSGVYMYVCRMTLTNGTTLVKKGSINLIR